MMADSYLREQTRNEITDALTAKLKEPRGYGSPGALDLDRFAYSARRIAETRLEFVTRPEDPILRYERLKEKYTVLERSPALREDVQGKLDVEDFGGHTSFAKPQATVGRQAPGTAAGPSSPFLHNKLQNQQAKAQEKKSLAVASPKALDDPAGLPPPKIVLYDPAKLRLSWLKVYPHAAGLINSGLTCYVNSSLQALINCAPFVQWIMTEEHCQRAGCDCVMCAVCKTVRISLHNSGIFRPTLILERLRMISKTLRADRQEDAHEFLRSLLSCLQLTYLKLKSATKLDVRSQETTPIDQIFGGYIRSQVICGRCGRRSNTYDHFQDLILDIKNVDTVGQALESYFKKEVLSVGTGYKCAKCKTVVPATKKFSIEKVPNVLIIQLKRFENSFRKIGRSVSFPEDLDLGRYSSLTEDKQISDGRAGMRYNLNGIVVHSGQSLSFGHYVAYMRSSDGRYYYFNDCTVTPCNFQRLQSASAYLLFYVRQEDPVFKRPNGMNTPNRIVPTTKAASNYSLGESSTSSSPSLPATYPLQGHKRPFIGPMLPPGRPSPAVASPKESKMSSVLTNGSPKLTLSEQQSRFSSTAEKAVGPSAVPSKRESGVKFGFLRTSPAALGVKPKMPVSLVLEHRRMAGGSDKTPSKPLVPYNDDEDSDVETEEKTTPARAEESPAEPSQPPLPLVVLSTHKWSIDDEKNLANRSDTSCESVSSTSGKWKVISEKKYAKKAKMSEPSNEEAKVISGAWEKGKVPEKEKPATSGVEKEEKVTGEALKRKATNGRRQSSPTPSSTSHNDSDDDRNSSRAKKRREADEKFSSRGSKSSSNASTPKGSSSLHGFGTQVLSWNGGPNSVDSELTKERVANEERRRAEREYDDDFDRGKEKKQKKKKRDRDEDADELDKRNRFDEFSRMKRERRDGDGDYHRHRHHQDRHRRRSRSPAQRRSFSHHKARGRDREENHRRNSSWNSGHRDHRRRHSHW